MYYEAYNYSIYLLCAIEDNCRSTFIIYLVYVLGMKITVSLSTKLFMLAISLCFKQALLSSADCIHSGTQLLGRSLFCLGLLLRYGYQLMLTSENQLDFPKIINLLQRKYLLRDDFSLKVRALQVCVTTCNSLRHKISAWWWDHPCLAVLNVVYGVILCDWLLTFESCLQSPDICTWWLVELGFRTRDIIIYLRPIATGTSIDDNA